MQRLPLALALLLASCAPNSWTVQGGTPEEQAQALGIRDAAETAFPDSSMKRGGLIYIEPSLIGVCGVPQGMVPNGCEQGGQKFTVVWIRWPLPGCADLTCSALAHELCHAIVGEDQGRADACGLLVLQEYRR